ncbi:polyphosphate kinase 2 [Aurantivibrio infirmus]
MKKRTYEKKLRKLQEDLVALQEWVKKHDKRIIIVFEGRDAAGKGGIIKAITQRVSHRIFRVVALPAPSDREKTQMYMQRYIQHFPSGGEIVVFDRSWYNRAGVEPVMGFCTQDQTDRFLETTPRLEKEWVKDGTYIFKYWLEVSEEEQEKRFASRIEDPVKQWKLSPMDVEARHRWFDYSRARDKMLAATDTEECPWHIVPSDDRYKARLNCISHILSRIPYEQPVFSKIELPNRNDANAYDDKATMLERRYIDTPF